MSRRGRGAWGARLSVLRASRARVRSLSSFDALGFVAGRRPWLQGSRKPLHQITPTLTLRLGFLGGPPMRYLPVVAVLLFTLLPVPAAAQGRMPATVVGI